MAALVLQLPENIRTNVRTCLANWQLAQPALANGASCRVTTPLVFKVVAVTAEKPAGFSAFRFPLRTFVKLQGRSEAPVSVT
jgi:hypothetical protein